MSIEGCYSNLSISLQDDISSHVMAEAQRPFIVKDGCLALYIPKLVHILFPRQQCSYSYYEVGRPSMDFVQACMYSGYSAQFPPGLVVDSHDNNGAASSLWVNDILVLSSKVVVRDLHKPIHLLRMFEGLCCKPPIVGRRGSLSSPSTSLQK